MAVASHSQNASFSAGVALVLTILSIGLGQVFKEYLSANRQGTLVAGGLGSLVFTFALTAISNFKMANQGPVAKAGLFEAGIALLVAVIASGAIHRVAITICVLFSGVLLFFLNGISQSRYHQTSGPVASAQTQDKKKNETSGKHYKALLLLL